MAGGLWQESLEVLSNMSRAGQEDLADRVLQRALGGTPAATSIQAQTMKPANEKPSEGGKDNDAPPVDNGADVPKWQ